MLWIKRIVTMLAIWFVLFFVFFFGSLVVCGAIIGARAAVDQHATDARSGAEYGRAAGEEFGRKYGPMIFGLSFLVSGGVGAALSFTGILPWCRAPRVPPPMPNM